MIISALLCAIKERPNFETGCARWRDTGTNSLNSQSQGGARIATAFQLPDSSTFLDFVEIPISESEKGRREDRVSKQNQTE